jgi:hypothetical protein
MFEKRPKFSFFLLGMFFGALCGGIIVYYNAVITNENKISVNLIPQIVKQVIGAINSKTESTIDTITGANNNSNNSELNQNLEENYTDNSNNNPNNNQIGLLNDSIEIDSSSLTEYDEAITIKKEELIDTKEVSIYALENSLNIKQSKNDSLIAVVTGTKDESKKLNQKILVELWKSPINYKGYQASKNKIIFYGLNNLNDIKLYSLKNDLILKNNEMVYYIYMNNDFESYERVHDIAILNQINKINP